MTGSLPAVSGRIFVSYRREDTAYPAGWLYDRLAERYGSGQVFKDVDSIELGDDFVEVITTAVGSCDVLLALIGKDWLNIADARGRRRLDDPDDFVRLEVEAALARRVRVIPILVEGARLPRADELPDSLARLVRRQALELSPARFDFDTGRLMKVLDRTLAEVRTAHEEAAAIKAPAGKAPDLTSKELLNTDGPERAEPAPAPSRPPAVSVATPTAQPPGDQFKPQDSDNPSLARIDHRAAPQARVDRLLLVAGQAAIVGSALLVAGLFPAYIYTDSLWIGRGDDLPNMRWHALYALTVAVLALGAGVCTLIPRTRRLIGPGLLLGVVAASTWGLLYLSTERMRDKEIRGEGWWLELVGHLVLVFAACLCGIAVARTAEFHLVRGVPRGELAWLVALLGAAGALALIFHDWNLWSIPWPQSRWLLVSSVWATVMALVVPACAAVAVPRRFGVALVAGWIGGGAAIFRFHYLWTRGVYDGKTGSVPIIIFGLTLLGLLAVMVLFARAAPRSQV